MPTQKCSPGCGCYLHRKRVWSGEQRQSASEKKKGVAPPEAARRGASEWSRARVGELASSYIDGRTKHPEYTTWWSMMDRCHWNPQRRWGVRGIVVCQEWHNPLEFFNYLDTVLGSKPPTYSLDRINNDGNYEPGNIRWASRSQQAQNRGKYKLRPRGVVPSLETV